MHSANIRPWKPPIALLIIVFVVAGCGASGPDAQFNGTVLKNAEPAPDFTLTNQFGQPVSLADLRGRVAVLTFLYTNCPDICPIVTAQLREVQRELSADGGAQFVAVSVDPERDTIKATREYLDKWRLSAEGWQFLVGEKAVLEPIWKDYYVAPAVSDHDPLASGEATPTPEPAGALNALSAEITRRYLVVHSTPVFLIDREGRRRVVFTPPLDPGEVAEDIRRLLNGG